MFRVLLCALLFAFVIGGVTGHVGEAFWSALVTFGVIWLIWRFITIPFRH